MWLKIMTMIWTWKDLKKSCPVVLWWGRSGTAVTNETLEACNINKTYVMPFFRYLSQTVKNYDCQILKFLIYSAKPSIQWENSPHILINTCVCRGQSFAHGKNHATAADLVACNESVLKSNMRNKQIIAIPPLHKLPAFHFQFSNLNRSICKR